MKRIGLVALVAVVLASPSAFAGQIQVGYAGSSYGPYQTGQGGEFTLNVLGGLDTSAYAAGVTSGIGAATTFQTFCIEGNEYIYPYGQKYYTRLDTFAENGGQSGQAPSTNQDPVSVGTGWLYSQFATGTLAGYYYGPDATLRRESAAALQNALWWLEGEENIAYSDNNIFMAAVVANFDNAKGGSAADFGVYALNIWTETGVKGQTQLFYVPDGGMTLTLLGGALIALGALRRKLGA